jgi:polyhydroxybutyrate depolymerase
MIRRVIAALLLGLFWLPGAAAQELPSFLASDVIAGSILVDGMARQFYLFRTEAELDRPPPLVIVLHGGGRGGDALRVRRSAWMEGLAREHGFVVAYPNGVANVWNDGRDTDYLRQQGRLLIDDVGFIDTLIKRLANAKMIDPGRVFVVGISNGGFMAFRLACDLPDRISAIAAIAAALPVDLPELCEPSRPIPVLMMNGTEDRLVLWSGGEVAGGYGDRGKTMPVPDTAAYWARANGCGDRAAVNELPDRAPDDGTRVRLHVWSGCERKAQVALYEIRGGGHVWSNLDLSSLSAPVQRLLGRSTRDIDGSRVIWQFFQRAMQLP